MPERSRAGGPRAGNLPGPGGAHPFAHAGPGSIFGEIADLDRGERTAGDYARAGDVPSPADAARGDRQQPQGRDGRHSLPCMRLRETDHSRPSRCIASRCGSPDCCCRRCACSRWEPRAAVCPSGLACRGASWRCLTGASRPKVNIALATLEGTGGTKRAGQAQSCWAIPRFSSWSRADLQMTPTGLPLSQASIAATMPG